jgi:hypothetical protein
VGLLVTARGAGQGVALGVALIGAGGILGRPGDDLGGLVAVGVAVVAVEAGGDVPDIIAAIAVGGKAQVLAAQFQVAQPHRGGEDVHLPAGVVDVILAMDRKADRRQQVRHHGAIGRAPAMADVQGTGGIGGDELDLDPLARAHRWLRP